MRNIFSSLGTKKVAGTVLAGATLLIGFGVVSNFNDDNHKVVNEASIARFGNSAYNNYSGNSSASRSDLERQILAGQNTSTARFLKGRADGTDQDGAFSSDGAYAEGVRGGASGYGPNGAYGGAGGSAYANGDAYQAFDSTYEQDGGGLVTDDGQGSSAFGEQQFQSLQASAVDAVGASTQGKGGKGSKNVVKGKGVRPSTQINKLASSKGGSSFSKGGTGGGASSAGFGGGSSSYGSGSRGSDNNTQTLPKTDVGGADSQAFKFGRAGSIGGFNVSFSGSAGKGGGDKGRGAANDLLMANRYSNKALSTQQTEGKKALAEAAFDGSNPEDYGPTIAEGATIGQVSSELSRGLNLDMDDMGNPNSNIEKSIEELVQKQAELEALQKKLTWVMVGTVVAALALSILIAVFKSIPWVAAIITFAAAVALFFMGRWMFKIIKQMQDPQFKDVNQGINWTGKIASVSSILLLSGGLIAAGWSNMWQNAWKNIQSFFSAAKESGGIKAGIKAAKKTSKAAEGFTLKKFFNIKSFIDGLFPKSK